MDDHIHVDSSLRIHLVEIMSVVLGRIAVVLVIVGALLAWIGGYWSPFTIVGSVFNGGAAIVNGEFAGRVKVKYKSAKERREEGANIFNTPARHPGCWRDGLDWQCH